MSFPGQSNAQYYINILGHNIDTVYEKLPGASDYERMGIYNELAFCHSLSNADSAIFYAEKALELAEEYDNLQQRGMALRNLGNAYALEGNYREAVVHLQQALTLFENIGNKRRTGEVLVDLGKLNYDLEDYEKALSYAQQFEQLLEQEALEGHFIVTPLENAVLLGMTAATAREAGRYPLAISYFKRFFETSKTVNVPRALQEVYVKSLAETYDLAGQLDSALKYTFIARSLIPKNQGKPESEHTGYEGGISKILIKQGKLKEALPYATRNYMSESAGGGHYYAAYGAVRVGDIYLDWKRMDSALFWYNMALAESHKVSERMQKEEGDAAEQEIFTGYQVVFNISQAEVRQLYYNLMLLIYHKLYKYYEIAENSQKALTFHKLKYAYKDSVISETQSIEERKMQARYESERMEQQVQLLQQEGELSKSKERQTRIFLIGVSGLLVIIVLMVLLYLRQNRLKTIQERIVLQQRLFRSQMNPHFLYNSLASIQHFIVTEDPDNASLYLSRFSSLVRNILDASNEEFVTLENELDLVENYLSLQQVRYVEKLNYTIEVDEALDVENIEIPPMLLQPFIENAIEHGIKHKEEKGNVTVRFLKDGDAVVIEVEDDGIGREKAQDIRRIHHKDHRSLATRLTRERIAILNRKKHEKITLEIEDLKDADGNPSGTKVQFKVPF